MSTSRPHLSVFILTYNQKQVVGEMLEGILRQQGPYTLELVIGDDASSDGTLEILQDYQQRYPDKIKLLASEKNMGLIHNFMRTLAECDGKYIAICDGDDYWTDPFKIKKQLDILEEQEDVDLVFTAKNNLFPDGNLVADPRPDIAEVTDFSHLIRENYISSVSSVFRNRTREKQVPQWILELPYGDWPLYLWTLVNGGKIVYLKDFTAVYRMGIGQSASYRSNEIAAIAVKQKILRFMLSDPHFSSKRKEIKQSLEATCLKRVNEYNRRKQRFRAFAEMLSIFVRNPSLKSLKHYLYSLKQSFKH